MNSHRVSLLLVALFVLACSSKNTKDSSTGSAGKPQTEGKHTIVCPSIYIEPHASIDLGDGAMRTNGKYAVVFEADGEQESCEFELSNIGPENSECEGKDCGVQSPSTTAATTCEKIGIGGIQSDGSIRMLWTAGTPKHVSLTLSRDGETLAQGSADPDYTPDECGFVQPRGTLSK